MTEFTYHLSYILLKKNSAVFLRFTTSITHLLLNFRKFVLTTSISISISIFLFLFVMSEKHELTISENLMFTSSICRILKSQETISLAKVSWTKQFNL